MNTKRLSQLSFLLIAMTLLFSSCKKDDDPAPKPVVTFAQSSLTVGEGDGTVEVEIQLDRPAPDDFTVNYTVGGTAVEGTFASADYDIKGPLGKAQITKGQSSGVITIEIKQDNVLEGNETIILTLESTSDNIGQIGTTNKIEITIDDDEDDITYTASFVTASRTVKESDGYIKIPVSVDIAPMTDLIVRYKLDYQSSIGPVALDSLTGFEEDIPFNYWDYYIDGEFEQITIAAGQKSDTIRIQLYSDFLWEVYQSGNIEKIKIDLVESAGVKLGTTKTFTLNITQEDGKLVALNWNNANYTDVDMDMILWIGEDINSLEFPLAFAANPSTTLKEERIFFPKTLFEVFTEAYFGLSYIYYDGTPSPLNYDVFFRDYENGAVKSGTGVDYSGSYTTDQINKWDLDGAPFPYINQTFQTNDAGFLNLSDLSNPSAPNGAKESRVGRVETKSWNPVLRQFPSYKDRSLTFRNLIKQHYFRK